ncbi:hypothetical protein GJR88_01737 [Dietzia sp. DQ12-45-1b]|nr:hypothetical protein GJR88_01737 [Dietzia sp. DQ12-45-1b]
MVLHSSNDGAGGAAEDLLDDHSASADMSIHRRPRAVRAPREFRDVEPVDPRLRDEFRGNRYEAVTCSPVP